MVYKFHSLNVIISNLRLVTYGQLNQHLEMCNCGGY